MALLIAFLVENKVETGWNENKEKKEHFAVEKTFLLMGTIDI